MVASGEKLPSHGKCNNVKLLLQGFPIFVDFYLLPQEGYDVVLGTQWLRTLGLIFWDFAKLQMRFEVAGKDVVLRGEYVRDEKLLGELKLSHTSRIYKKWALVHFFSIGIPSLNLATTHDQVPELKNMLARFKDDFEEPHGLPPSQNEDHRIPLMAGRGNVYVKPYQYPHYQMVEIKRLVKDMLSVGVIRPNNSPYSSPVILVKKYDGLWCMCVDYHALNKITIKDKFHIPVIDELLDELNEAEIFSKLDPRSGYYQIRVAPEDKTKTAF